MKKCYTLILLCLLGGFSAFSQTFYWIGPTGAPGGNWNNTTNWSLSIGGPAAADFPKDASDNAVFTDRNAMVLVNTGNITLNSIFVTNSRTVTLYVNASTDITVNSGTVGNEGVNIDAGSVLRDSVNGSSILFRTIFAASSRGEVDGQWFLGGLAAAVSSGSVFSAPSGTTVNINSTGRVILRASGLISGTASSLLFNAGSYLIVDRNGGITPTATWNAASTIRIVGNTSNATSFNGTPLSIGNLEYECPGLTGEVNLSLNNATTIKGSLKILNTAGQTLRLAIAPIDPVNITVEGNLEISPNSIVAIAKQLDFTYNLTVKGNYIQTGGLFSLQDYENYDMVQIHTTSPSTLKLMGNFTQTGGTFTARSNSLATNNPLFVLEMNGSSGVQTISASSGTIDNTTTKQVALRLNNPAGITLNSSLSVGKIHFMSGVINTTNANLLTINNPYDDVFTVIDPRAESHVNGPVKRKTERDDLEFLFPVGKGGVYHGAKIRPSSTAASEYTAEYFNMAYSNLTPMTPLTGVSNVEYWQMVRNSGASARILLELNGAVPGAGVSDAVVVAGFASSWVSQKGVDGTKITPGNATFGTVSSQTLANFNGVFTLAYGPSALLPIKLKSFSAEKGNGVNALHWQAECYSTHATFEIERSSDGRNFTKVHTIVADQLRCQQPFDYDDNSDGKTAYYRIRVVDVDGAAFYSRIIAINYKSKGFEIVGIYPTVVTNSQLKVNVSAATSNKVDFFITNTLGQIMKRIQLNVTAGDNVIALNVQDLRAGNYQLTGYNSEGEMKTFRFIKQ